MTHLAQTYPWILNGISARFNIILGLHLGFSLGLNVKQCFEENLWKLFYVQY